MKRLPGGWRALSGHLPRAGVAMDAIQEGKSGLMAAISGGGYALVPIPDPKMGPRKVDVATMYNTKRYRPAYNHKQGLPIF